MAAQAVQPHLDRAQAYPLATAHDATAPGGDLLLGGDRQTDDPAELDAVRAFVEIDQHRQRVRGAGLPSRGLRHGLGRLAGDLARR
ncbi:MAG TPA: hypothetical protein VGV13_06090 [Methylomirabilota bacterium]|nr:hypothetical protein [Methylomirabilota bacterium]